METRLLVVGGHLQALSQMVQAPSTELSGSKPSVEVGSVPSHAGCSSLNKTSSRNLRNTWCPVSGCLEEDWEA